VKARTVLALTRVVWLQLVTACVLAASNGAVVARDYSLGVVPQFDARRIQETWEPLLGEVKRRTGIEVRLLLVGSIPDFERRLLAGEFDIAYMNPYHFVVANRRVGYAAALNDGSKQLKGIIVVRKDSPITEVRELDGKKVAMPAPNALGAALLPRAEFARKFKIAPVIKYVRTHTSVYRNVALGIFDAGGGVAGTLAAEIPEIRDRLRVLYRTVGVPPHPIAFHPRVPAKDARAVTRALVDIAKTDSGKQQIAKIPIGSLHATSTADYEALKSLQLERFFVAQ